MSIKPVSDIVLDVARAADPIKSFAAAEKLARLGPAEQGAYNSFSTLLGASKIGAAANVGRADLRGQIALNGGSPVAKLGQMDARTKAYKGLEQLLLQNLVENMLPKESSAVFGSGSAGDIWRSMLAEQLAAQVGKTVDLGLFKTTTPAAASMRSIKPIALLEQHS